MNSEPTTHPLQGARDIDSAMNLIWAFYTKNFVVLFVLSFVLSLLSQFLMQASGFSEIQTATTPEEMLEIFTGIYPKLIIIGLVSLIFNLFLGFFVYHYPGMRMSAIITSLGKTLKSFLPYLVIMIIFSFLGLIGLFVGIFALVVGAFFVLIYLVALFALLIPVVVVEDLHIGETMGRAFSLTNKRFWPNMGWTSVFMLILIVVSMVLSALVLLPFTGSFIKSLTNPEEASAIIELSSNPAFLIASSVVDALTRPFLILLGFTMYYAGVDAFKRPMPLKEEGENGPSVDDLYSKPKDQ